MSHLPDGSRSMPIVASGGPRYKWAPQERGHIARPRHACVAAEARSLGTWALLGSALILAVVVPSAMPFRTGSAAVASAPQSVPGWSLVSESAYKEYGFFGTRHSYVYRTAETACG
jgi:hypothetical protein